MKAIVRSEYGSPDVLSLQEIPTPRPAENEVLVRVHAASVNRGDWEILTGSPLWVRLAGFGLVTPKVQILGSNLAGRIEAVGGNVTQFKVGDDIFGDILDSGLGAFAEYVCLPERASIIAKPETLSFEDAASVPEAGLIALQAIRDKGRVQPGQKVLINGAGGGAGTFAIQFARSLGAEVTGVDRGEKLDLIRSLGAVHAYDYTQEDFAGHSEEFDLVVDTVGTRSMATWKRILRPHGTYLAVGGSMAHIAKTLLLGGWISRTTSKKIAMLGVRYDKQDLLTLTELLRSGDVATTIERHYPLAETAAALRHVGEGKSRGKVVIRI